MSKAAIIGGLFGVIIICAIVYLSLGLNQYTCEVCVTFNERTQCRTAAGADKQTATQTAHDNACAFLVTSKTDGFLCGQKPPSRLACQEP
jgi:hypothetical protein